jgi:signal transduction histidine kinase
MARLIESLDWTHSPLGPIALWPQSLKTTLNIILRSRFQLAVYWGPELIFLYNDAEREVVGDLHPYALGKPAREVLVDMWDEVGPMLHKVLQTGEATWSADRPLKFDRFGQVEEAFFTWSYSPIPDDAGGIGGVLLVTQETTRRVSAERQLAETAARERELRNEADSQRALLETVLNQMPAGVVIARAPSGEVVLANGEAERILQQPVRHLRNIDEYAKYHVFRPDGSPYRVDDLPLARSIMRGETRLREEMAYRCPDGTLRVLLINSAPVRDEAGKIVAGVAAFQDITDLRLAQEELLRQSENVINQLAGKLITAQEEERTRIARDLHDDLGQQLAALCIEIDLFCRSFPPESDAVKQLVKMRAEISRAGETTRQISHGLHHSTLVLGLPRALESYCREFSKQRAIKVNFTQLGSMTLLPEPIPLVMFRVAQEALNNVARHSGANQVEVSLLREREEVRLRVKDRGNGFDPMQTSDGLGLVSMRERLRLVGGTIKVSSAIGLGTELEAVVPLSRD